MGSTHSANTTFPQGGSGFSLPGKHVDWGGVPDYGDLRTGGCSCLATSCFRRVKKKSQAPGESPVRAEQVPSFFFAYSEFRVAFLRLECRSGDFALAEPGPRVGELDGDVANGSPFFGGRPFWGWFKGEPKGPPFFGSCMSHPPSVAHMFLG